ncbi:MAG: hypothetical protein OXJ37_12020, partial [Bryobacterales bacterium]|nr:hypothetical protein [Bryobacterales bacterium]
TAGLRESCASSAILFLSNTRNLRRRVIPELFGEALEHGRSPDRLSVLTERPVEDASTRNERFNRLNVK